MIDWQEEGRLIKQWIKEACAANELPMLHHKIVFEWSTTMTRAAGKAYYAQYRIRLSVPLWPKASRQEREETTKHEVCHIIAYHKVQEIGHQYSWQRCMLNCGLEPEIYHHIPIEDKRKSMKCIDCGTISSFGPVQLSKFMQGLDYRCRRCGCSLRRCGRWVA